MRQFFVSVFFLICAAFAVQAEMYGPIAGQAYGKGSKALVLIAHGDSGARYIQGFARQLAAQNPDATVIHMARPGYQIPGGQRSKGSNNGQRDHYTKRNNKMLSEGVLAAAQAHPHRELIVIGHSGGANQFGVVIAQTGGAVDTAILLSGGYDIGRWRQVRGKGAWPRSQSATRFVKQVPASTRIIVATGSADANGTPGLAKHYVSKLQGAGKSATYVEISGAGHGFASLQNAALKLAGKEIRN